MDYDNATFVLEGQSKSRQRSSSPVSQRMWENVYSYICRVRNMSEVFREGEKKMERE